MKTATLKTAAHRGGPVVFGAGAAMLAVALMSPGHGPATAAPRPGPTVTSSLAPVVGRTPRRTPGRASPSPSLPSVGVTRVFPAGESAQSTGAADVRPNLAVPSGTGPSGPSPSPSAAAQCRGALADVRAVHALCVSIGGPR